MTRVAMSPPRTPTGSQSTIDSIDRRIIEATQGGLPLCERPYRDIARQTGIEEAEVIDRLDYMLRKGIIRRIGAVPNHYALGYRANGMSVWDVPDDRVREFGQRIGALEYVSHSYHRPRHPPLWTYNLFAMVHGRSRSEVERQIQGIAEILGDACRSHDVLYSTRVLKKTGLRLTRKGD